MHKKDATQRLWNRVHAKKIAWRDIPEHLRLGTYCWYDRRTYEEVMASNNWSSQGALGGAILDLIIGIIKEEEDLPEPFVLMFRYKTWKEISHVAYCVELQAEAREVKYCVDWWYGEPGNSKSTCLIAFRHLGIAELTLTESD